MALPGVPCPGFPVAPGVAASPAPRAAMERHEDLSLMFSSNTLYAFSDHRNKLTKDTSFLQRSCKNAGKCEKDFLKHTHISTLLTPVIITVNILSLV